MDQKKLELLKNRDPAVLEQSFREINPYLLKMLYANRITAELADELVQSTWETFFKNLDKFEGRSQLRVFLGGILINKIREFRRAQKRVVYEEDSDKILSHTFTADGWWNLEPDDPEKIMSSQEVLKFIEDCMEGLSESQRDAFIMKEVEIENTENICNILGVSISNLGVLLFRAKDKLRKCLDGKVNIG